MRDAAILDASRLRLRTVLQFGARHLGRLPNYAALWDDQIDPLIRLQDKILAESALFALLISRDPALVQDQEPDFQPFVREIQRHARDVRQRILLMRYPQTVVPIALTHAALTELGFPDAEMQHLICAIFDRGLEATIERIPYRTMETRWVRALVTGEPFAIDDLAPQTILGTPAHPFSMSREDMYALTHAVMYMTQFGETAPPRTLPLVKIASQIDACLSWTLVLEDLDLMIELILAATLLRTPWSPTVRVSWDHLNDVWRELDFLPSLSLVPSEVRQRSGARRAAYVFQNTYHTMFVAGLLDTTLVRLRLASQPPDRAVSRTSRSVSPAVGPRAAAPSDDARCLDTAVEILSDLEPTHRWWRRLITGETGSAHGARMVIDAALIAAARSYDLGRLLVLLDEAILLDGAPSSTVLEAVDFLVRQQLPDGLFGAQFLEPSLRAHDSARPVAEAVAASLSGYAERLRA